MSKKAAAAAAPKLIDSFEEACKALGILSILPDLFGRVPTKQQPAILAHYKLVIIAQALNEGWEPNWNDEDECKWYPWFDMETYGDAPAGSGFSFHGCGCDNSATIVGSRLCFKSRQLAEHAGKHFIDLYKDYFLIPR